MSALASRDRRSHASSVDAAVRVAVKRIRSSWVVLAEGIYQMSQGDLFSQLGYASFEEWLADPDIDIERRWAYQLKANYYDLVVKGKAQPKALEAADPSKVAEILPAVRRGQVSVDEALGDVVALSRADLREKYRAPGKGATPTAPDTSTVYDAEAEAEWAVCHACGQRYRIG